MDNKIKAHSSSGNNNEISFILPKEELADIIVNFLGKKESIKYELRNSFILDFNDVTQFYYLLDEKIKKEQFITINYYNTIMHYDNETSRNLNGIDALNSFAETRPIAIDGITLEWNIILKFPNGKTIENQKIELTFFILDKTPYGYIELNIEHTNQAWGIEVLTLFKNHIDNLSLEVPSPIKILDYISSHLVATIFIFYLVVLLPILSLSLYNGFSYKIDEARQEFIMKTISLYNASEINEKERRFIISVTKDLDSSSIDRLSLDQKTIKSKKLSLLLKNLSKNIKENRLNKIKDILYGVLVGAILALIISFYIKSLRKFSENKSFILITKRSEKKHDEYIKGKNKFQFYSISLFVFSIVSGVVATVIHSYFT